MPFRAARWLMPSVEPRCAASLAASLGILPLAASVLVRRGYADPDSAAAYLHPDLDSLHDPFLMAGMRAAVTRLCAAIASKERILLYGDYDVDGTSSIVILKKALELAGAGAGYHVPHRLKDGYGMRPEVIEQAAAEGVRLIVSVDTGIRAGDVVRHAGELGIDVIVTDHHLPEAELPPALAVLNPNQPGCRYPEKNLCGAGVAFKLVQALFGELRIPSAKLRRLTASFLKLVAVATVADVVPLTGENRVIVKHGLANLIETPNPGLKALLAVAGFAPGDTPTAGQVAFRIAPRINAAGRMSSAKDVIELFLTGDPERARQLASQCHELNHDRRQTEAGIVDAILAACETQPVTDDMAALVFAGENWHRGVVGIVASRIVERFHRPVFVLGIDPGRGEAHGSGRSIPSFHLLDALESMPELFTRFGGHRQAAGVSMAIEQLPHFRLRLNAYAAGRLTPEDFVPQLEIDAETPLADLTDRSVREILDMQPFGFGNPAPLLMARAVRLDGPPTLVKEKHLRLRVSQDGRRLTFKAWNFAHRAQEFEDGRLVDLAFSVEQDSYSASRGYAPWAAVLKDVRPSGA